MQTISNEKKEVSLFTSVVYVFPKVKVRSVVYRNTFFWVIQIKGIILPQKKKKWKPIN